MNSQKMSKLPKRINFSSEIKLRDIPRFRFYAGIFAALFSAVLIYLLSYLVREILGFCHILRILIYGYLMAIILIIRAFCVPIFSWRITNTRSAKLTAEP